MHLGFATLGCPGAPLDDVLSLAQGNDFTGLELRAAPDEFTNTALTAVEEQPLEPHLELAADLGARGVRVFPGDDIGEDSGTTGSPSAGEIRALDRVTTASRDVPILLETHDSHSTARQVAAFCALLDTDVPGHNVKAIW